MDDGERQKHRKALEIIAANPENFGFHDVKGAVAIEMTIKDRRGTAVAEPDLHVAIRNGDLHLVEYKNRQTVHSLKLARKQLKKAKKWYVSHEGMDPEKIYTRVIFGDNPAYAKFFEGL